MSRDQQSEPKEKRGKTEGTESEDDAPATKRWSIRAAYTVVQPEIDKIINLTDRALDEMNDKIDKKVDTQKYEEDKKAMAGRLAELEQRLDKIASERPTGDAGEIPPEKRLQSMVTGFHYGATGPEMVATVTRHLKEAGIKADQVKIAPNRNPGSAVVVMFKTAEIRITAEMAWSCNEPKLDKKEEERYPRVLRMAVMKTEKEMAPVYKMNKAAKCVRELESKHRRDKEGEALDIRLRRELMSVGWMSFGIFESLGYYNNSVWEWTDDAVQRYEEVALRRVGAWLT